MGGRGGGGSSFKAGPLSKMTTGTKAAAQRLAGTHPAQNPPTRRGSAQTGYNIPSFAELVKSGPGQGG